MRRANLLRQYPLLSYFCLAYAISWLLWLPLVAATEDWIGPVSRYWHLVGSLGPALAAFIFAGMLEGKASVQQLVAGITKWRVSRLWWAVAALGPVALLVIAVLMARLTGASWPEWRKLGAVAEYPQLGWLALVVVEIIFYGYGEEVGWRGYVLPRLQSRYNALWASVLISIGWSLWHLPLFLVNESYRQMGVGGTIGWYLSMLTGSILLTWLYNSTDGSILLMAIFHGVLDLVMANQAVGPALMNSMGMLTTLWGIAILVLERPARLSHHAKVVQPEGLSPSPHPG
ncbi:MAG: type II CAAX endopeptidase family protein [Caldilineaceae bacterium]